MTIGDIENEDLRNRAIENYLNHHSYLESLGENETKDDIDDYLDFFIDEIPNTELILSFNFFDTEMGSMFWFKVDDSIIIKLPKHLQK